MSTTNAALKPAPQPDDLSQEFFDGAQRGELMLTRCNQCSTWLFPTAQICTECLSEDLRWEKASGRGTVFTFGVMHQFYHEGFTTELPYNVTVVELEEGPRLQTNLIGIANDEIKVGMPVEVRFPDHVPGFALPKFTPVRPT